jgi:hypothetical protein
MLDWLNSLRDTSRCEAKEKQRGERGEEFVMWGNAEYSSQNYVEAFALCAIDVRLS